MSDAANFWPKRRPVDKNLEKLVTHEITDVRKFVRFGMTQTDLKSTLQIGCKLTFMGEAQGAIIVEIIEDAEGRDLINGRAFRIKGTTENGLPIIAHIWFDPAENETESPRTAIYFDPNKKPAVIEKPKIETQIRFTDGWEKVRDDNNTFGAGGKLNLRIMASTDWPARTVDILTRTDDEKTNKIIFKVTGEHKFATVILDLREPANSKIIFD